MNCMKCGRETQDENVFCQECLTKMEEYPIHSGAVVFLPRRREASPVKKAPKRHVPTAEEQIAILRKRLLILMLALVVCIAAIVLMFNPTLHYIRHEHFEIGQNYSTVVPSTNTTTPSSAG